MEADGRGRRALREATSGSGRGGRCHPCTAVWYLRDDGHGAAQVVESDVPGVVAVDEHAATVELHDAEQRDADAALALQE